MRHLFVLLAAGLLCVIGAVTGSVFFMAADIVNKVDVREIQGTDLEGHDLKLSDYRGKVVLVAFWTSTDHDGQGAQDLLKRLQAKFDRHPFRVVGVNGDESRGLAQTAAGRHAYRSFFDGPDQEIARSWYVTEYPTFLLIDHEGREAQRYNFFLIEEEVETDIIQLLREVPRK
jgi:thiol-disulfide isomerase/thioredoxin